MMKDTTLTTDCTHNGFVRFLRVPVLILTALFALQWSVNAQLNWQVLQYGQWAGPFDLQTDMQFDGPVAYSPAILEIAHAIVLPPASPADVASSPYAGKVLFINDRGTPVNPGGWENNDEPTFVWDPLTPGQVDEHILVGNTTYEELFCSGHTFLGDGTLITVGGLNRPVGGGPFQLPKGHGQSFILRTDLANASNSLLWDRVSPSESMHRWYPSPVTLDTGGIVTAGHFGQPMNAATARERFLPDPINPSNGVWQASLQNYIYDANTQDPTCSTEPPFSLQDYPRLHVTMGGKLMYVDGEIRPAGGPRHGSYFLPLTGTGVCSTDPSNPFRWREGQAAPNDPDEPTQAGGNSVHLIARLDGDDSVITEVVYYIGGTKHGQDDKPCPCKDSNGVFHAATNRVSRITNPNASVPWDLSPPNLNYARANANAVILLDGSILVVGGADNDGSQDCDAGQPAGTGCVHRRTPELFKPPEVFEGTTPAWAGLGPQTSRRQYHSVAGLLPDGRVFSAGGTWAEDWFTVEIFSPPYVFATPRPRIVADFTTAYTWGETVDFDVAIRSAGVKRVAILRNASVTHAFDFNQRYIELREATPADGPVGGVWTVHMAMPDDGFMAPPGWYMLTVVDTLDRVSPAKWIKIG